MGVLMFAGTRAVRRLLFGNTEAAKERPRWRAWRAAGIETASPPFASFYVFGAKKEAESSKQKGEGKGPA